MTVSRIRISRNHLKNIKERHIYDGLYHYRKPKDKKDIDLLIVAALYDMNNRIKAADNAQAK